MDGMSALLVKCALTASGHEAADIRSIFSSLCLIFQLKNKTVEDYKTEIIATRLALDSITTEVADIRSTRDNFMSGFLGKFCLVVNSKKSEIKRLCDEVDRLRDQVHSLQTQLQGAAPALQSEASVESAPARRVHSSSSSCRAASSGASCGSSGASVKVKEEPTASSSASTSSSRRTAKASKKGNAFLHIAFLHVLTLCGHRDV
jgi:hypothetical protein